MIRMRKRVIVTACKWIIITLISIACYAEQSENQGKDWQTWNYDARYNIVSGTLQGFSEGWGRACIMVYKQRRGAISLTKMRGCSAASPSFGKNIEQYIAALDDFYKQYPQDQHLTVKRVLLEMSDGRNLTVAQLHEVLKGLR